MPEEIENIVYRWVNERIITNFSGIMPTWGKSEISSIEGEKKHQHRILLQIHPSRGEIKTEKLVKFAIAYKPAMQEMVNEVLQRRKMIYTRNLDIPEERKRTREEKEKRKWETFVFLILIDMI